MYCRALQNLFKVKLCLLSVLVPQNLVSLLFLQSMLPPQRSVVSPRKLSAPAPLPITALVETSVESAVVVSLALRRSLSNTLRTCICRIPPPVWRTITLVLMVSMIPTSLLVAISRWDLISGATRSITTTA
ncbi:MAG: hypothetical protein [Circoviridae sp.]|nr:MAG: hypothetical protein [Circoviridae sp.]